MQRRAGGEARRARRSGGGREGAAGAVLSAAIFVGRVFSRRGGSDCWEGLEMMGPGRNHPAGGREGGAPRRAGTIGGRGGSALEAPWAWAGSVGAAPARAGRGRGQPAREAGFRGQDSGMAAAWGGERDPASAGFFRCPACLGRARARWPGAESPRSGPGPGSRSGRGGGWGPPRAPAGGLITVPQCLGLKSIPVSFLNDLRESAIENGIP